MLLKYLIIICWGFGVDLEGISPAILKLSPPKICISIEE